MSTAEAIIFAVFVLGVLMAFANVILARIASARFILARIASALEDRGEEMSNADAADAQEEAAWADRQKPFGGAAMWVVVRGHGDGSDRIENVPLAVFEEEGDARKFMAQLPYGGTGEMKCVRVPYWRAK